MTRYWTEAIAAIADVTPGGIATMIAISVLLTIIIAIAWYLWPWSWRRSSRDRNRGGDKDKRERRDRFRLRPGRLRWRLRRRKRKAKPDEPDDPFAADELPDLPAEQLALTADQLAAAGRFKEAVRERLRAMVRDLIEQGVLTHTPGWTVTELAVSAVQTRPALSAPMYGAVGIFSEIWYGLRPATADDDQAMRQHAARVAELARQRDLAAVPTGGR